MSNNISHTEVLREMMDIRETWRRNDFTYEPGQKERYELLLAARRMRVQQLFADGEGYVGGSQSK